MYSCSSLDPRCSPRRRLSPPPSLLLGRLMPPWEVRRLVRALLPGRRVPPGVMVVAPLLLGLLRPGPRLPLGVAAASRSRSTSTSGGVKGGRAQKKWEEVGLVCGGFLVRRVEG
jgi:hypothetical protein